MSVLTTQCKSGNERPDTNNNIPCTMKSYSLRPRGVRISEDIDTLGTEVSNTSRTKRKTRPMALSKYRRKTANARERSRMREINEAFDTLRRVIPEVGLGNCGEKPTKISTLRLAMRYITALNGLLRDQHFLEDHTLPHASCESLDGLTPLTPMGDNPSACLETTLSFMDPLAASSQGFDDSSCLLDDIPLFMSEFS